MFVCVCVCVYIYIYIYIYNFLLQKISEKKYWTFISMGNATQKSRIKKPYYIKKSLKCVQACCSEWELSVDWRKWQTWLTTLLTGKENFSFLTPAFQQKFSMSSCTNCLCNKKLSDANNLNKPPSPLRIFITSIS